MALTKILTEGIKDGEILNVDINDNASIAKSKLASLNILNADINASAGIVSTKLAKPIDFADNEKARFGTGSDFQIYHDGTHSHLKHSGTGNQELLLSGNIISLNNGASNEYMIKGTENGSVDLYYDNSVKLSTSANGVVIGTATEGNESADDLTIHSSTNTGITVRSGTSNNGSIFFSDAISGAAEYQGFIQYQHATDDLTLGTSAVTAMTLDSSGRLLVGTATEGFDTYGDDLTLGTSGHTGMTIRSGTTHRGSIYFSDGTSGDAEYQGYIQYNHDDGRLVFGTTATERLRIHSSGQIQLGGTSLTNVSSFADDLVIGESGSTAINGLTFCSTNSSGIRFHDTGDVGELEFNHSDNSFTTSADGLLKYRTNSAERMRINSSGNVGIGLTNPEDYYSKDLVVKASSEGGITIRSNGGNDWNYLLFAVGTSGAERYSGYIGYSHQTNKFRLAVDEDVSGNKHIEVRADGNLAISDGNLVVADGHGIDFSGTFDGSNVSGVTSTSELLDDYEEGTFEPILKRLMTNNVTETNYYTQGTRQGNYTRIGDRVWITGRIHWDGGSTGSGSLILTNLPFTINSGGANEVPLVVGYRDGLNYTNVTGYGGQNMNRFYINYFDSSSTYNIPPSATDSSGALYFAAQYELV
jgi:hypothetical protein